MPHTALLMVSSNGCILRTPILPALTDRFLRLQQLKKEALGEDSEEEDEDDEDGSEDSTDEEEVGSPTVAV